jgi:hypothetical protein
MVAGEEEAAGLAAGPDQEMVEVEGNWAAAGLV